MEETVIVAWDGSGPARAALNWAIQRQGTRPGPIRLVQIIPEESLRQDFPDEDDAVSVVRDRLDVEAESARLSAPRATVTTDVLLGDPEQQLRRLSEAGSLLVVGTRARDESSARFGWSLGAQLAPSTRGVLAIVPEHVSSGRSGVVVGVNGSRGSMSAAVVAAMEAVDSGQELHAVHAWVEPIVGTGTVITGLNPDYVAWLKVANQRLLDDSLRPVERRFPGLRIVRHLERDLAVHVMKEHAKSAALLVVGTRGYGPVRRLLLGSVSHSLILGIQCPILVVGESALSDEDYDVQQDETDEAVDQTITSTDRP